MPKGKAADEAEQRLRLRYQFGNLSFYVGVPINLVRLFRPLACRLVHPPGAFLLINAPAVGQALQRVATISAVLTVGPSGGGPVTPVSFFTWQW